MRIRTIKPEFWRHRELCQLSEFSRLLAIALLNVADDEGYFQADPFLLRGDVFPYEADAGRCTVGLRELSGIGYVEIREHPRKGPLGKILAFTDHQVINKGRKSELRKFYEQCSDSPAKTEEKPDNSGVHVGVQSCSGSVPVELPPGKGKGTGNREGEMEAEQGKGNASGGVSDSVEIRFDDFWQAFPCKHGKQQARKAYVATVQALAKNDDPSEVNERLITAAESYARYLREAPHPPAAKYAQGWLNQARYEDDFDAELSRQLASKRAAAPVTFAQQREQNTKRALDEVFGDEQAGDDEADAFGFICDLRGGTDD